MTPRVKFSASCANAVQAGGFAAEIAAHLDRRRVRFGNARADDRDVRVDVACDSTTEAETLFQWLSARLGQTGGPVGRVTFHECSHAAGETEWEPCVIEREAS